MENVVLTPAAGQTVVATRDHDHNQHHNYGGHNHSGHGHDSVEARADFRSLTAEVERFGTINGDRIKDGFSITGDRVHSVGSAAQLAACRTDSLVQSGFGDTAYRICESAKDSALAACKTDDAIGDSKLFNAVQFKDQVIEANKNAAGLGNLISTVAAASNVLATSIGNAASVQATANYNGLTVLGERIRAELGAKQDAGFAAATLIAFQNKADSDAKAQKCCCDGELRDADNFAKLTALVVSEGNATRSLINTNTIDALRAQLVATQRLIPVTIPVGAG